MAVVYSIQMSNKTKIVTRQAIMRRARTVDPPLLEHGRINTGIYLARMHHDLKRRRLGVYYIII